MTCIVPKIITSDRISLNVINGLRSVTLALVRSHAEVGVAVVSSDEPSWTAWWLPWRP